MGDYWICIYNEIIGWYNGILIFNGIIIKSITGIHIWLLDCIYGEAMVVTTAISKGKYDATNGSYGDNETGDCSDRNGP